MSHDPKFLYKYRSVDELALDALKKRRVWYALTSTLNDPFDVATRWKKDFSDKEIVEDYLCLREKGSPVKLDIRQKVDSLLEKKWTYTQILEFFDNLFKPVDGKSQRELLQDVLYYNECMFSQMGVLSLSADPLNSQMWAHYAKSHGGFCLGFEFHETNVAGQFANPVTYTDKKVVPSISHFQNDSSGGIVQLIANTKPLEWIHEKEWRIIKPTGAELSPYPGRLKQIILGMKISDGDVAKLRECVRDNDVEWLKISKSDDSFGLRLNPV